MKHAMKRIIAVLALAASCYGQTAVPAVQYDEPEPQSCLLTDGTICLGYNPPSGKIYTRWKCADSNRVLLTTEDGKHICVTFPDEADANKPYNVGVINMGDSYGPRGGIDWIEAREFEERSAVLAKYPTAHLRTSTKQPPSRRYTIVVGDRQISKQCATAGEAWRSAWEQLKGAGR